MLPQVEAGAIMAVNTDKSKRQQMCGGCKIKGDRRRTRRRWKISAVKYYYGFRSIKRKIESALDEQKNRREIMKQRDLNARFADNP